MNESKERELVRPATEPVQAVPRKRYERPHLTEWGSLRELTGGPISGLQDVVEGGTENE
jgi:hypothetical protein